MKDNGALHDWSKPPGAESGEDKDRQQGPSLVLLSRSRYMPAQGTDRMCNDEDLVTTLLYELSRGVTNRLS